MGRAEWIAELEAGLVSAEEELVEVRARVAAFKAQLAVVRSSVEDRGALDALSRTDAIVEVLRASSEPLSISGIVDALAAGGRAAEPLKTLRATLSYLVKQGRVSRVGRGQYIAAE